MNSQEKAQPLFYPIDFIGLLGVGLCSPLMGHEAQAIMSCATLPAPPWWMFAAFAAGFIFFSLWMMAHMGDSF